MSRGGEGIDTMRIRLKPKVSYDIETVDWDVQIEQLPPRCSEQVVIGFVQGSYRPPCIIDNPED